jgi:hypothetical protein
MPSLSQTLTFKITNGNTTTNSTQVSYPNTATGVMIYNSEKTQGDGYFGGGDGVHTVMYTATPTFVGTVTMQASLASAPTSADWFNVPNTSVSYTELQNRNFATVDYFNFTGNFVWVRGVVSIKAGAVESILYNH